MNLSWSRQLHQRCGCIALLTVSICCLLYCQFPPRIQSDLKASVKEPFSDDSLNASDIAHLPRVGTVPIEEITVGMRVPAFNPAIGAEERVRFTDPDPLSWRLMELELQTASGRCLRVSMLRPIQWIHERSVHEGGEFHLSLPDLGVDAQANVLAIKHCPPIQPGPGHVVLSTFSQSSKGNILDITVGNSGDSETIGVTEKHPFWSVRQESFVSIGDLEVGAKLLTVDGRETHIARISQRTTPNQLVFNIEVNGEHVYFVGEHQLLVHNACDSKILGRNLSSGAADPVAYATRIKALGYQAAHVVPTSTWARSRNISDAAKDAILDAQATLDRVGIDINDVANGFWAKPRHMGSHTSDYFEVMGDRLRGLQTRRDVEFALNDLRRMLQDGLF